MSSFNELKNAADNNWNDLVTGNRPLIRVGTATCGQAAGAIAVVKALRQELEANNIVAIVQEVGCLGLCFAEPLVDILKPGRSRVLFNNVKPSQVSEIIQQYLLKDTIPDGLALAYMGNSPVGNLPELQTLPSMKLQRRIALRNAGHINPSDILQYVANGGYEGLRKALFDMQPADVVKEVTDSGLRGRGGAAFSAGVKWGFLVKSKGPVKYILANCEEGDPGAFNDKGILESDPYTLLEGMTIAGYATGAPYGYIFIRHGHEGPIERARKAVEQAYSQGILGKGILGSAFNFDVEVALTGESYVAGEETALMEAIEGHRAMPRVRPPFPAQVGLWGKPSDINNVKTLSYVPEIVSKGGKWFASIGLEKSTGTAIVCLTGHVQRPGMYEIPMGLTLSQVVNDIGGGVPGGKKLKLLQTGGPLGGVLDADGLKIILGFDEMAKAGAILGSGGIIVGNEDVCAVDLTRVLVKFAQFESCGRCFPCRIGQGQLHEVVERIARFEGTEADLDLMRRIGTTMKSIAVCGHGQLGFNPVDSALKYFLSDFVTHIKEKRCPTGSCNRNAMSFKQDDLSAGSRAYAG